MNPNASLKSLKVKVRAIASRPAVSVHPGNPFRADFRASADNRSAMTASRFRLTYPNTRRRLKDPRHNKAAKPAQGRSGAAPGNHDADVTPRRREICYNIGLT